MPFDMLKRLQAAASRTGSFGGGGEGEDVYKVLLGKSGDELANEGRAEYPDEPVGSAHHRLASRLATERFGGNMLLPQLLGLGVEGAEAMMGGMKNPDWLQDTASDLRANAMGSWDALQRGLRRGYGARR